MKLQSYLRINQQTSFLNSFWFQLLGRKPSFTCRICGKRGGIFMKNGVQNVGQFEIVGRRESGHMILECADRSRRFDFDPNSGGENWHEIGVMGDMLNFVANEVLKDKQAAKQPATKKK